MEVVGDYAVCVESCNKEAVVQRGTLSRVSDTKCYRLDMLSLSLSISLMQCWSAGTQESAVG